MLHQLNKVFNWCNIYGSHLENQNPSVGYSQTEFSPLPVLCGVQADAVHLQTSGDFQQLVVRDCRSLPTKEGRCLINQLYFPTRTKIFVSLFIVRVGNDFWILNCQPK